MSAAELCESNYIIWASLERIPCTREAVTRAIFACEHEHISVQLKCAEHLEKGRSGRLLCHLCFAKGYRTRAYLIEDINTAARC